MIRRYRTQMALPEIGAGGQDKLATARALVVGAGGLGCPALAYLAGAGVGRLTIVDPDRVELVNLHRQTLYREADAGRAKALAAAESLRRLNGTIAVTAHAVTLDPDNAPSLVAEADVVIDAADSFAVTYTLSDLCRETKTPLISASAIGFRGYAGGFCGTAPSYRAVFPEIPNMAQDCATAGVIGSVVGMLGACQAQFALGVLLGLSPAPLGQVVTMDALHFTFSSFRFDGAEEPARHFPFLGRGMLRADDRVIELRPEAEAPEPVVPGAMRISLEELSHVDLPGTGRVVLVCRSGLRAWRGALVLRDRGLHDLALLAAGR